MNKTTQTIVKAFNFGENKTVNNSYTQDGKLYLHNNCIAKWENGKLYITTAGWNTKTTKERLNGLNNVSVYTKKHQLYLNNKPWDGEWVCIEDWNNENDD